MTWRKSPRGAWVAHDGVNSYSILPIWCYEKGTNKQMRCWRMRINNVQVGGADKTAIWMRVSDAKAYADSLVRQNPDPPKAEWKKYVVHVTWRDPAWDEKDGADIETEARSKADACKYVRRQMRDGGHTGVMYFKATEVPSES